MASDPRAVPDVRPLVDDLLAAAMKARASDIHVEPAADGYEIRFRVDGLLDVHRKLDAIAGRAVVARLMVMARLLTYRLDVPQEGRISLAEDAARNSVELRLAIMPTIHGLRAAVRMPAEHIHPAVMEELGLPWRVVGGLHEFAAADSGMLIVTGPAGSGKTTTIYAVLRQIVQSQPGVSIVTLEDPVERALPGVTQIEVSPFGQLTYEKALRSILRQDPQVLMLGEIRDAATASLAVQAALSGHRLITTLHASTCGGAIARLLEMAIEPYQISSSLHAVVSQRLLRRSLRLSPSPAAVTPPLTASAGIPGEGRGGGPPPPAEKLKYLGRIPIAEMVIMQQALKKAVLERADAQTLAAIYRKQPEFQSLAEAGEKLVSDGLTDTAELQRVLGSSAC